MSQTEFNPQQQQQQQQQPEIPRRKLINAGISTQKFRRAVVEAAAEIRTQFTEHYWKEVVQGEVRGGQHHNNHPLPPPTSNQLLKKGFVYYLNATGKYLVLREHLRQALSQLIQQRVHNVRPSGFQTHRDFQIFLQEIHTYLVDEVHETLGKCSLSEADPLERTVLPPKGVCDPGRDRTDVAGGLLLGSGEELTLVQMRNQTLLRDLLFYAEESFAQGDFEGCHRIHLQRISCSRELPSCWMEFALMWCSRGDGRMAEIAVREALRISPDDIYGMIIGGLIATSHNDSRGIVLLQRALDLKPLSPELHVILGAAFAFLGDEGNGNFYFRRGAYLHRLLIGEGTEGLEEFFEKLEKSTGDGETGKFKNASMLPNVGSVMAASTAAATTSVDAFADAEDEDKIEEAGRASKISMYKKQSERLVAKGSFEAGADEGLEAPSEMSIATDAPGATEALLPTILPDTTPPAQASSEYYTRKSSLPKKSTIPELRPVPSKFDFTECIEFGGMEDVILPALRPSILIPWNVTEYSEALKRIIYIDAATIPPPPPPPKDDLDNVDLAAPDSVLNDEYEQLAPTKRKSGSRRKKSLGDAKRTSTNSNVSKKSLRSRKSGGEKEERKIPTPQKSLDVEVVSIPLGDDVDAEDGGEGDAAAAAAAASAAQQQQQQQLPHGELLSPIQGGQEEEEGLKILVNRLGSELIWAGMLLLQLRMFEMLDGILTRELYATGKRTIQFLYLRAMSLYMRRCHKNALPFLEEALTVDPEGHCYYEMGEPENAAPCYEKVLRLPVGRENRHLLYLRYGSMAFDREKYDTGKRVFLYGIQKYPTPFLWMALGNICYITEEYEEAEAAFSEANRLDNTNPNTWAHLSLVNLATGQQALAEQSYKWALRFGLKKGKILDEIKRLQGEKGFGDSAFPRIPNCIPHDYYVRRLGRQKPFDIYREALMHDPPNIGRKRFDNTDRENALKEKLTGGGGGGAVGPAGVEEVKSEEEEFEEESTEEMLGNPDSFENEEIEYPEEVTEEMEERVYSPPHVHVHETKSKRRNQKKDHKDKGKNRSFNDRTHERTGTHKPRQSADGKERRLSARMTVQSKTEFEMKTKSKLAKFKRNSALNQKGSFSET